MIAQMGPLPDFLTKLSTLHRTLMEIGKRPHLLSLTFLTLTSCSVGPDYERPEFPLPAEFTNISSPTADPQLPASCINITTWWQSFSDPTLNTLITEAVASNLDYELARARVREARGLVAFSRSDFIPQITTNGSIVRNQNSKNAVVAPNTTTGTNNNAFATNVNTFYEAGFDANWEIDIFGQTRREVEVAIDTYQAQIEAQRNTLVTLLAEVAQNYMALRSSQRTLEITKSNVAAQRETLDLQRMKFDAGLTSALTVSQAEALLQNTASQLPALEAPIMRAIHRISVLLGREPSALAAELLPPQAVPQGPSYVPPGLPADLLRRRPDVRQAERVLAAATANIGVAVADLFPKLELTGRYGFRTRNSGSLIEENSRFWSVGPNVSWEILNWYGVLANIEVQNARQEQALIAYRKVVLQSLEEVENALVAYDREQERRERLAQSVAAQRKTVDLAIQLNREGVADFLNVLTAQQDLFQAEDALTRSDGTVAANLIALYKALGGGWERFEAVG